MLDFTLTIYSQFLKSLQLQGYTFITLTEYITYTNTPDSLPNRFIILRHDVDRLPQNALIFARLQNELGIKGTYYFRIVPHVFNESIISEVSELGHEIGYHYEDVNLVSKRDLISRVKKKEENNEKRIADKAIKSFEVNLNNQRRIVPINTICMHGSPLSRHDSRLLWKYYNYRDFAIIGEPYFDIDFSKILYLTDTGRSWNGTNYNIRDNIKYLTANTKENPQMIPLSEKYNFRSTYQLIKAAEENKLPDKILITFHPQRWTNRSLPWVIELVWQNFKNLGKYFIVKIRN